MGITYQCHYCGNLFPAEKSIDGYEQGYKVGFLCPLCGKNIKGSLFVKQEIPENEKKWHVSIFILFIPVFLTKNSEVSFHIFGTEVGLHTLLFCFWLLYGAILLMTIPSLAKAKVIKTFPVNEEKE